MICRTKRVQVREIVEARWERIVLGARVFSRVGRVCSLSGRTVGGVGPFITSLKRNVLQFPPRPPRFFLLPVVHETGGLRVFRRTRVKIQ